MKKRIVTSLYCFCGTVLLLQLFACGSDSGATVKPVPAESLAPGSSTFTSTGADGWAVYSGSTTGGNAASTANTYTVTTRAQFLNALKCGTSSISDTAKIINVSGMIDLSVDDSNNSVDGLWYITQAGYSGSYASWTAWRDAYVATCTSAANGSGTPETVRLACLTLEKSRVVMNIGSNTTIIGIGADAGFKNGSLVVSGKTNVVIRNVSILDAYDWFAFWDYADVNVNSDLDGLSITNNAAYVWIDHCTLGDGARPDSSLSSVTITGVGSKKWVVHDGLLDVTKGANYVTISYNKIMDHDKTMLIGSSDGASATDSGKLKVSIHHNWFYNASQRLPRVRFGQVHVYNNYY